MSSLLEKLKAAKEKFAGKAPALPEEKAVLGEGMMKKEVKKTKNAIKNRQAAIDDIMKSM